MTPPADPLLQTVLASAPAFSSLNPDDRDRLCALLVESALADGHILVRQHEPLDQLYVVLSGRLALTMVDTRGLEHDLDEIGPGQVVGGMNAFSDWPAPATVRAIGPVRVAALSAGALMTFADNCPAGHVTLMELLRPQLRRHRLWVALYTSAMFRDVDRPALIDLESEFELVALYGGEVLFRQDEPGDDLYVVVSGRLRVVYVEPGGDERVLAELGAGETVGEMAVISGERRSATVYAARDSELARLSKASVDRLIERHPSSMVRMLTGCLVSRLRSASRGERTRSEIATVAIVPTGPGVAVQEVAARLADAFGRLGRTLHLTSRGIDSRAGRSGAAQALDRDGGSTGLLEWLAGQEVEHRYVLYEADPVASPWTERCIRQADRIVLVASASGDPAAGEIETEVLGRGPAARTPLTLVLVHEDGTSAPTGTARWLEGRRAERHLHVRRSAAGDYDRVARFVTGSAVGLALGGGFARGLAHLGVWRAARELNVSVDAIGGSSMGAIVGALLALGWDHARIVEEISAGFGESFDDMTIPFLAFKRGGRAARFLRRLFQDVRIEDLWMPYFCVSANLNRSEVKVHTSGDLARAVLASSRAPGIFPPMVIDGELHVDGGLINNVPVDIMRSFSNDGLVIGVDVSPPHELHDVQDYGEDVSGWRAAWHRFNPAQHKRVYHPSILLVLMRIIEFGGISYRRQKAEMADVYISPEVLRFPRNDFPSAGRIVEAGYVASIAELREWLAAAPDLLRSRRPDLFEARADANPPLPAMSNAAAGRAVET